MTTKAQLQKDLAVVQRALGTEKIDYQKKKEECNRLFREHERLMDEATCGMSREEKTQFQHNLAKSVAKDYVERKI